MRYAILIAIGLILAVGVSMALKPSASAPIDDSDWVLVSTVDLQPGSFIVGANHVGFAQMDAKEIKPNFIQKKNVVPAELEGAVVRGLIKAGEPIQKDKIVMPKEGGFLSAVLYPGKRAISVGVDVVSANAGFIFPGDKVDLLLTHEVDTREQKKSFATETFVEDVRVLAIDQQVNNPERKALVPKTVTLEVTPKQAEEVLVATELGKISLILRSSGGLIVENAPKQHSLTRDNEVSRIINESRPLNRESVEVTITRGKQTSETSVNSRVVETPEVQAPAISPVREVIKENKSSEAPQ